MGMPRKGGQPRQGVRALRGLGLEGEREGVGGVLPLPQGSLGAGGWVEGRIGWPCRGWGWEQGEPWVGGGRRGVRAAGPCLLRRTPQGHLGLWLGAPAAAAGDYSCGVGEPAASLSFIIIQMRTWRGISFDW